MSDTDTAIESGWEAHAAALAAWASQHLANRSDGYGCYSRTGRSWTEKRALSLSTLERHFKGEMTIGLHTTSRDQTCRWCCWDFDAHDDDKTRAESNMTQVLRLQATLATVGLSAIVEDSNGAGGYHVWILFDAPRPAWDVYAWGHNIIDRLELVDVEFFPKQPRIAEWGNFVRIPGRHHKRKHWSRFLLSPNEWTSDDEAAQYLLDSCASPTHAIPVTDPPVGIGAATPTVGDAPQGLEHVAEIAQQASGDDILRAISVLRRLKPSRADNYDQWVRVGMALHMIDPGPETLAVWEGWSRKSPKYKPGDCSEKWRTFKSDPDVPRFGLGSLIEWMKEDDRPASTDVDRAALLKTISERLSESNRAVNVTRVWRRGVVGSTFDLELENRIVSLGDAAAVMSFSAVRKAIADGLSVVLSKELKKDWDAVAQMLLDVSEVVDIGTEDDETRTWLDMALHWQSPLVCANEDDLNKAKFSDSRVGFVYEDITYIRMEPLLAYMKLKLYANLSAQDLGRRLSRIGWKPYRFKKLGVQIRTWVNRLSLSSEVEGAG